MKKTILHVIGNFPQKKSSRGGRSGDMAGRKLKISSGMIIFNGDTFLREVLESIYDFAYEIIIVEGPDQNALPMAGPDGASCDRTMEIIENFPDPLKKIRVIRGIWKNKDQQSNWFIVEATY